MKNQLLFRALLALAAALPLSACFDGDGDGGSNGGTTPPPPLVPDSFIITSGGKLVGFAFDDPTRTVTTTITGIGSETVLGGDFRPADGLLYVLTKSGSNGKLYTVNTSTGAATAAPAATLTNASGGAAITLAGTKYGVDFNPVADRLRVVGDNRENLRIDVTAAASNTTVDAPVNAGLLEAAYTNSFSTACQTDLYYLNGADLLLSASPNGIPAATPIDSGRFVGSTGLTATAVAFDIRTQSNGSNTLHAVLTTATGTSFVTLATATGAVTGQVAVTLPAGETPLALALPLPATAPALAPGNMVALTSAGELLTFNRPPAGSPAKFCTNPVAVTGLGMGETLLGMDTRPNDGALIGLGSTGKLYTLDPLTGVATSKSTLIADAVNDPSPDFSTLSGTSFGVDFNPTVDRLRVVSNTGQNLRINVDTGATITDTALNGTATGSTAVAYTNSAGGANVSTAAGFQPAMTTALFYLDTSGVSTATVAANSKLLTTSNPNGGVVSTVGTDLGVDLDDATAFEIDGRVGAALIAGKVVTAGTAAAGSSLFSVDLVAGSFIGAKLGDFDPDGATGPAPAKTIIGMTGRGAPSVTVFGLTTSNKLVSFKPNLTSTVTAIGTISLPMGANVLGLDFRPSVGPKNGQLVALGSDGKLYAIRTDTAEATLISTLSGAGLTFVGTNTHGVDFNPLPDRLRVVSESGQNLRINSDSGATTVDTGLTGAIGTAVHGAGYTNSFSNAGATTLFYLVDTTDNDNTNVDNSQLATTASPNAGVLTTVGTDLGTDFSKIGDLDFGGGHNGFAYAALQPQAGGKSSLYLVNTTAGTVARVFGATSTIDTAGDEALVGIAVRVQ